MFSQRPEYIVAGEILRTSRMYAMSVSPLSADLLHEISPRLYGAFVKGKARQIKAKAARDYTNFVKIGNERSPSTSFK